MWSKVLVVAVITGLLQFFIVWWAMRRQYITGYDAGRLAAQLERDRIE